MKLQNKCRGSSNETLQNISKLQIRWDFATNGKARHSCYNFCSVMCVRAFVRLDLSGP